MVNAARVGRVRGRINAAARFVASAPLTYLWLVVLLATTLLQRVLTTRQVHELVLDDSTNIAHLVSDPLQVLVNSLFWIDGRYWFPYLVLFTLFLAPVERWLGHLGLVTVGLTAHVGATYLSEGLLWLAIRYHQAPERMVHARDIGVSYFLVGVMAVLAYRIVRPWRWFYCAVLLIVFGFPVIAMDRVALEFTAIGHFVSLMIGFSFYPMARHHPRRFLEPPRTARWQDHREKREF